jgi:hypothetical protein
LTFLFRQAIMNRCSILPFHSVVHRPISNCKYVGWSYWVTLIFMFFQQVYIRIRSNCVVHSCIALWSIVDTTGINKDVSTQCWHARTNVSCSLSGVNMQFKIDPTLCNTMERSATYHLSQMGTDVDSFDTTTR